MPPQEKALLHHRLPVVLTLALLATLPAATARPTAIPLANASFDDVGLIETFEGQTVLPTVFGWTETGPKTPIEDPVFGTFDGLLDTGTFVNTEIDLDGPGGEDPFAGPIPNVHGANNQLAFMVTNRTASPEVTLSQETGAAFTAGHQYQLTVALSSSLLSPLTEDADNPALFEIALGYFDGSEVFQTVAFRQVANEELAERTGFDQAPLVDFDLLTDVLGPEDAAIGENVAIRFRVADGLGGAWNIDNVRLVDIPEPGTAVLLAPVVLALLRRSRLRDNLGGAVTH